MSERPLPLRYKALVVKNKIGRKHEEA